MKTPRTRRLSNLALALWLAAAGAGSALAQGSTAPTPDAVELEL